MKFQTGFALHQEKRDKIFREKIIPPPGYGILEFDAAGQEFRWMAEASGDTTMKSLCLPGEDPHSYMGSRIRTDWEYRDLILASKVAGSDAEKTRYSGKAGNLSLQYRTSWKRFLSAARVDYNIDMKEEEAQLIHSVYPRTYTQMPVYWEKAIQEVKNRGYAETFSGRRVKVMGNWQGKMGWSMGSTAINYKIQGTGAEQKYLAMAVLKSYMHSKGAKFAWDLHDGLYWYVPLDKMHEVAREGKRMLDALPFKRAWDYQPSIPMPWDCKFGLSWGKLREWKE